MSKRVALSGIAILLLIAVAFALYWYNKPREQVANRKPDVSTTAEKLFEAFDKDEKEANKKFLDKIILVSGTVEDIQTSNGSLVVMLNAGGAMGGISCRMINNQKPTTGDNLSVGKHVLIKGKCAGFLMDVNLTDCVPIEQ